MKVLISAGHTLSGTGTGAAKYINESKENRILGKKVYELLKNKLGDNVDYHEVNTGSNYLSQQVTAANKKKYDLVVQIHFNANKVTNSIVGTEVWYKTSSGAKHAKRVVDQLGKIYNNRGPKQSDKLYWLNNTNAAAILIETCFVDSKADTDIYNVNKNLTARLIAEGILGQSIGSIEKPLTPGSSAEYRVCIGSYANRSNADKMLADAKAKGFKDAFIIVK